MNLLARTAVSLRRWISPDTGFAVVVVAALFAVEVLGREHARSDLHDLLAVSCLTLIGLTVFARYRRTRLAWLEPMIQVGLKVLRWLRDATFQIGLDMRGTPPVKRGLPPILRYSTITLVVLSGVLLLASPFMPNGLRESLSSRVYLLYLLVLSVLWFAMAIATLLLILVPMAMIHDACLANRQGTREQARRREIVIGVSYLCALFVIGIVAPVWLAPVICCVLFAIHLAAAVVPGRFTVQVLWRPHGSIKVRAMSWGQWVACEFGLIALSVIVLTLASCGALFYGDETAKVVLRAREAMPVTTLAGVTLAWLGPGFMTILCANVHESSARSRSATSIHALDQKSRQRHQPTRDSQALPR